LQRQALEAAGLLKSAVLLQPPMPGYCNWKRTTDVSVNYDVFNMAGVSGAVDKLGLYVQRPGCGKIVLPGHSVSAMGIWARRMWLTGV